MEYMDMIQMVMPMVFAGGIAWGGVKVGLNGTKDRVDKVELELDRHKEGYYKDSRQIVKTLAALETKVDLLIQHKIKE